MPSSLQKIPLLDLKAQYSQIQDEVEAAVLEVLRSAHYVLGPNVKALEEEAAKFLGIKHAISCANGSDALYLALLALDIKAGDEIITTPFTFAATAEAISQVHARPVFADINPDTFNIDAAEIEKKITDKTKAIILVHLYGQACEMDEIVAIAQKHNLKIIEDAAQAFGTRYTSRHCEEERSDDEAIQSIQTYSFYPTKNLSAAGDAGMLSTNCEELAARLKRIRVHGSDRRYYHDELGVNSRLDEIQAAILRIKLKHIEAWNQRRAQIAAIYNEALEGKNFADCKIQCPQKIEESNHIYHQYTIKLVNPDLSIEEIEKRRNQLKDHLAEQGIASEVYYPLCLHQQKLYKDLGYQAEDFPHALAASKSILCLPIYPELKNEDISHITSQIR